jgi:hypothetical protein
VRRAAAAAVAGLLVFCVVTPAPARATAAEEGELLSLVNALRSSRGLRPAVVHAELRALADEWARRMAAARAISHSPLEQRVHADWVRLGENVAVDVSVEAAERALEASPDHLTNLVTPAYDYIGIGVAHGADGGVYVVQEFMQLASGPPRQPPPAVPKHRAPAPARPRPSPRRPPLPSPRPLAALAPPQPSSRLTEVFGRLREFDAAVTRSRRH